ncbi:LYR motif containing protein 1-like [Acipenser ruthenus]|uniref:LYR motif containing protein 1-like n=1 Tax=Acipenser ruthenus TaxID=7906 RepID=UPI0027405379|nr:LYR motif containing protein 1-like [Acipenser ruthenus]
MYHSVAIKTGLELELLIQSFLIFMSQSGLAQETDAEKRYIVQEASTLFRQNMDVRMQNIKILTEHRNVCQLNKDWLSENGNTQRAMNSDTTNSHKTGCPSKTGQLATLPTGLATQGGRKLHGQESLRKQAKPVYLHSHDETS